MKRLAVRVALLAALGSSAAGAQGGPAIFGTVRTAESNLALAYTVIAVPSLSRELFSNDRGGYTLRELPVGPLTLRFRHVGFTPRDTQVVLRPGDTLRVDIALARLAIRLDAMHVTPGCARTDDVASGALAELFEQVRQNAAQYRLLIKSYPFTRRVSKVAITRMKDGQIYPGPATVVQMIPSDEAFYKPGRVFQRAVGRAYKLNLPELLDFADSLFIAKHCFSYGGEDTVDSTSVVKMLFAPVADLKDPDIEGTVTLRADGYGILAVELRTTSVPRALAGETKSARVLMQFREILPGISILSSIESWLEFGPRRAKAEPKVATSGEIQMLEEIKWKNGPP